MNTAQEKNAGPPREILSVAPRLSVVAPMFNE
jgi:hypothetical protein